MEALEADGKDDATLRDIQKILYSTEVSANVSPPLTIARLSILSLLQEGFEVPDGTPVDEEETF